MKYIGLLFLALLLSNCKSSKKSSTSDEVIVEAIEEAIEEIETSLGSRVYQIPYQNGNKIQFYAVQIAEVDMCNKHNLTGKFQITNNDREKTELEFISNGIISTKMGCPDDNTTSKKIYSKPYQNEYILADTIEITCSDGIFIEYRKLSSDDKLREAEYK